MPQKETIQNMRFEETAPALEIAVAKAKSEGLIPNVNFT